MNSINHFARVVSYERKLWWLVEAGRVETKTPIKTVKIASFTVTAVKSFLFNKNVNLEP